MIDEAGQILTTSSNIGGAPVVSFTAPDGVVGEAWVIGRDDDMDLALLEVINSVRTFQALSIVSIAVPAVDEEVGTLNYAGAGLTVDQRLTRVIGVRQDLGTGLRYFQLGSLPSAVAQGGIVIDQSGIVRGIRMAEQHLVDIGIGRVGESYAMGASSLETLVIPRLESGVTVIHTAPGGTDPGQGPPPLPAIYRGDAFFDGAPLPVGTRVYARVSALGVPDIWESAVIADEGRYVLDISIPGSDYDSGGVEFWVNKRRFTEATSYVPGRILTFPLAF